MGAAVPEGQGRVGRTMRKTIPQFALSHNLGGFPSQNVAGIAIVGRYEQ
jgi:acetyl-CoA C-acetyltransferase